MRYRLIHYCNGVIEAAVLLVVVVTPLFFNLHSSRVFEPDKVAFLRALAVVITCTWLIGRLLAWDFRVCFRSWGLLAKLLAALIVAYLVSTLLSVAPLESVLGSYHRQHGAATAASLLVVGMAVASRMRSRAQIDRVVRLVAITSLPVALYALLQWAEWDSLIWYGAPPGRPPSTLGNPIFLAAYVSMGVLASLAAAIGIVPSSARETTPRWVRVAQIIGYMFIALTDLAVIGVSGSRGPLVGLASGLFFLSLLSTLYRRRLRWAAATIAAAAALIAAVAVLNLGGGPFAALRDRGPLARLGHILDIGSNTQRTRALIWEGTLRLVLPNAPVVSPEAAFDGLHLIRPLVGYGPETLPLLFGRVYPPALASLEGGDILPDRAHSQAFDTLVTLGLLGALAVLGFLIWLLQLGLSQLGFQSRHLQRQIVTCLVGGASAGAALAALWGGFAFTVVAAPFGLALGLALFLGLQMKRFRWQPAHSQTPVIPESDRWRAGVVILALSILLTHVIETGAGISVVATSVVFWICAGLIIALPASDRPVPLAETGGVTVGPAISSGGGWLRPASIGGVLTALLLVTLVYDFVAYERGDWWRSISPSFSVPERTADLRGTAVVIAVTWLIGGALATLGELTSTRKDEDRPSPWWPALLASLAGSLIVAMLCWLIADLRIAAVSESAHKGLSSMAEMADRIGRLLTDYVIEILGLLALLAGLVRHVAPATVVYRTARGAQTTLVMTGCATLLIASGIGLRLSVQPIRADMMHDVGTRLELRREYPAAIAMYQRASRLAPYEDDYYLALDRAFLSAARSQSDPAERDLLLDHAVQALQRGRALNPLNPDYTVGLARVYAYRTGVTPDPSARRALASRASAFYAEARDLTPNHAELWSEWATLTWRFLGDRETAAAMLKRSRELNPNLAQTERLLGDLQP